MGPLVVLNGCRTLQLTRGLNTLVDEGDHLPLSRHKWHAAKSLLTNYARRFEYVDGRRVLVTMHRVIMSADPRDFIDHKNCDGLDNRRSNLRTCTHSQNHCNRRRSKGRSRFKGVSLRENGTWRAYYCVNRKLKSIGHFRTEVEAARAYDAAASEHYGEFARTNADLFGDY